MPFYSNAEMADMHFMYGCANGNALEACRLYAEAYPNRQIPSSRMFSKIHQRLRDNGKFGKITTDCGRPRSVSTPAAEEIILEDVHQNPGTSVRIIAAQEDISPATVWRVLKRQQLYPYHIQRVQALALPDYDARLALCRWFLRHQVRGPNFGANIIFTDEAGFTKDGIFNFHNSHHWSDENPHMILQARHQHRFSLNVWLGILGDRLLGPIFLPNRLNGDAYLDFLQNSLPQLLEEVPLNVRRDLWFMHDGAPAHFSLRVRQHLNETFLEKWIGRGGPVAWPPRSPDLNMLDFFLWGYLKSLVYAEPIRTLEELQQRVLHCCHTIRAQPGIFERVRNSFHRRCTSCIEMRGVILNTFFNIHLQ